MCAVRDWPGQETGQSSWEKPDGWPADDAEDAGSDDDEEEWLELTDPESGAVYYYNNKTGERRWTNPHQSEARDVASDVDSDDDDDDGGCAACLCLAPGPVCSLTQRRGCCRCSC